MKKGFTILEMILVLTVITVIMLLTIPNIAQKRDIINKVGCKALLDVIDGQILIYQLDGSKISSIDQLVDAGLITSSQTVCPSGEKIVIRNGEAAME